MPLPPRPTAVTSPAYDICDPSNPQTAVDLYCSLMCCGRDQPSGGMGWPMTSGTLNVQLYAENCYDGTGKPSIYYAPSSFNINMSCPQTQTSVQDFVCTWTGKAGPIATTQGVYDSIGYGYLIRLTGSITAIDFNTVAANFTLQRLASGDDFVPAVAGNAWITCASGSALCYRVVSPGVDPNDRSTARTFVSNRVAIGGGDPNICGDAHFALLSVVLLPYQFGCATASLKLCALAGTGSHFSCLRASVKPMVYGTFAPQFAQLGTNEDCGPGRTRCGCFNGKLTGGSPAYTIDPSDDDPMDLLSIGCPGEAVDKEQQIQVGTNIAGYDVLVKTIAGTSGICVACRVTGGGSWTLGSLTVATGTVPWIASAEFPSVSGQPKVLLYGLTFPYGALGDCTQPGIFPSPPSASIPYLVASDASDPIMWPAEPVGMGYIDVGAETVGRSVDLGFQIPPDEQIPPTGFATRAVDPDAKKLMERITLRTGRLCRFMGRQLSPALCCGTSALHECEKFGTCRYTGRSVDGERICLTTCNDWEEKRAGSDTPTS